MIVELNIIRCFLIRENFEKFNKHLNNAFIQANYGDLGKIFSAIRNYYEKDKSRGDIGSVDTLALLVYNQYPGLNATDKESIRVILERLKNLDNDPALILEYLESHKNRSVAAQIAHCALEVADGRKSINELLEFVRELHTASGLVTDFGFVNDDLQALYDWDQKEVGLRWRLMAMNKMLGSLRKGNMGFIFARPEVGKTSFLCSEVTHMAGQTSSPVVYFNNEQPGNEIQLRLYQAALGIGTQEIFKDIKGSQSKYRELVGDRIKLFDAAHIDAQEVEAICKALEPGLIVFDQLDKIKGFKGDRKTQELGEIYRWTRELSKTYCPIIGVCQAGATAENKRWLEMSDIDESKVSKPAEADFIVGIGKETSDAGLVNIRFLHACKNKLHGDPDSIPEMRHGKYEVKIREDIARFEDLEYNL